MIVIKFGLENYLERMRCSAIVLLLLVICCRSFTQFEPEKFQQYTPADGLSNRYISGIAQDSSGYLWISTYRGLNRFDGNSFKVFLSSSKNNPIPDNTIFSSEMTGRNELAIATSDGAQLINLLNLTSRNLEFPTQDALRYWSNSIQYIRKDADGNYGLSTKTGFYIFSPNGKLKRRFDHYTVKDIGHSWMLFGRHVYLLPNGNLLQENSSGFFEYKRRGDSIGYLSSEYPGLKSLVSFLQQTRARFFFVSADEILLCNSESNSLDLINIRTGRKSAFKAPFRVGNEVTWQTKLCKLSDTMWALTSRIKGFFLIEVKTGQTQQVRFIKDRQFSNYFCSMVFRDRDGRHWIGTNEGLFKEILHSPILHSFSIGKSTQPDNWIVSCLYVTENKIYAGTDQGYVFVLDKQKGSVIKRVKLNPSSRSTNCNSMLQVHRDTLWIGTESGLRWFHINNYSNGPVGMMGDTCRSSQFRQLFADSRGDIWLASSTINCILRYERSSGKFHAISDKKNPLLKINLANSFAEDKVGNIWIGGDGIARWNVNNETIDTLIERLSTQKNRKKAFTVMRDLNGDIWVSVHDDGLARITGKTIHVRNENLTQDNLSRISPKLLNGYIFIVTNHYLGVLDTRNLRSIVFNMNDGLPDEYITSREFAFDSTDLSTWLASSNMISRVPNLERWDHERPPVLKITEVSVINDSLINNPSSVIRLNPRQNDIRISLSAINFDDPGNMRFAYRLRNQDDTAWVEMGSQQEILLTNLSSGTYLIETRLRAFDNRWPEQTNQLTLIVGNHFWQAAWFWIVFSLIVLSLIYLVYRWRITRVRKLAAERLQVQELKTEEYKYRYELEQIINYFNSSLADKKNVEEVLWDVARNLIGTMGYVDCMIYLWNKDKTKMIQKAGYGPKGSPEAIASQVFDVVPGQGVVGYVMQTKEPVLIEDTRTDQRYRMDEMFRLSEICVPIIHNNELIGIIDSEHHELHHFKERDLKILTTIATLVGDKIKQIESENTLEIKSQELALMNGQLAETQLAALQTQMNPHFIFNALNSIKRMILDNEKQNASRYLSKFAHMIRLTLNHSKETFVTLQENIEYLHAYLEMEQLRFDDSFAFHIETSGQLDEEETSIPSLMIQPLVENAIWHGLMHKEGEKKILIGFHNHDGKIVCTIEDNGIGINNSEQSKLNGKRAHRSVGLENLRNRIKILNDKYDMDCSLEIVDLSNGQNSATGTRAVLEFKTINN